MGSKRRFKEDELAFEPNQNGLIVNKKFISDKEYDLRNGDSIDANNKETTQSSPNYLNDDDCCSNDCKNDDFVVNSLVNDLISTTETNLNNEQFNKPTTDQCDFNAELDLDDSFKLNYDFSLIQSDANQDAFFNQQLDNSFNNNELTIDNETATAAIIEHNYANLPTTSSSSIKSLNDNQSKTIKGALKNSGTTSIKKNVKFKGVTVFYFPRSQGGSTVPSQGGSSLGMDMNHCKLKNFSLDAHQEEKRQVHRDILLRQKRFEKLCQQQRIKTLSLNQSDSDEDSLDNISDISDSELDFDSWYFLQPVPVKQRRALLRESGVVKIDSNEKEECRDIRSSREFCGCDCRVYCDPETCQCSLNGIKCQVDRSTFPCGCSRSSCGNSNGRIEFNPLRVRTHFVHTIMRLELEKKNENQQFNDDTVDHHQNNIFTPITTSNQFNSNQTSAQYDLKPFTTTASTTPDVYNNLNILNCNETNLTTNDNYSDSGSSYSENSDCTSEELDCGLTSTVTADNQLPSLNSNLSIYLSPFSLLTSSTNVPTTNTETLNGTTMNSTYENNQLYHNSNFLTDQSFRYYSTNLNSTQQPDQTLPNTTTNDQLIYQNYYPDQLYGSLSDCYTQTDLNKTTDQPLNLPLHMNNGFGGNLNEHQPSQFEMHHHYTDLSESIASSIVSSNKNELIYQSTGAEILDGGGFSNEFVDDSGQTNPVVNSDDSSSRQSLMNSNCTNLDNYLTSSSESQNEQEEEDNFGEIIKKNTIVESVTA